MEFSSTQGQPYPEHCSCLSFSPPSSCQEQAGIPPPGSLNGSEHLPKQGRANASSCQNSRQAIISREGCTKLARRQTHACTRTFSAYIQTESRYEATCVPTYPPHSHNTRGRSTEVYHVATIHADCQLLRQKRCQQNAPEFHPASS